MIAASMRRSLSFAYIACSLLCFTHQGLSQIGQTKEELIQRYGQCHPDPAGKPKEPSAYDSVIDVGENCTFHTSGPPAILGTDDLIITALFKDGKAVSFDYRAPFVNALSAGRPSERNRRLWELDILRLLSIAVPVAQWINIPSNSSIQRWRTKDSRAFAYYFADCNYHRHELVVQTAAVNAVFKETDTVVRELRPK